MFPFVPVLCVFGNLVFVSMCDLNRRDQLCDCCRLKRVNFNGVTVGVTVQCQQLQNGLLDCRGQHRSCDVSRSIRITDNNTVKTLRYIYVCHMHYTGSVAANS